VCNIATQAGETDLYTCHDHVRALEEHAGEGLFDVVLCNDKYEGDLGGAQWVRVDDHGRGDRRLYRADLLDAGFPWRHDSARLASVLMDVFLERTGPLSDKAG
jgi:2-phospho-L-lactate transferase/gluconeogenesis factor (CofD/UPF0052 family)